MTPQDLGFIEAMTGIRSSVVLRLAKRSASYVSTVRLGKGSEAWQRARFDSVQGEAGECGFDALDVRNFLYFESVVQIADENARDIVLTWLDAWHDDLEVQCGGRS